MIYEGEYLNGKKHGKGKDFDNNGNLIFEGEYLNGKKWNGRVYDKQNIPICELKEGKGFYREYNFKHKLTFEGEYLNGERNGKGKEYGRKGKLLFEGEFLNGKRNGKGKEYDYNFNVVAYEGDFLNGLKSGQGKQYGYKGELIYEGEFFLGIHHGLGKEYLGGNRFEGIFLYNTRIKGRQYFKDKLEFEGEYLYNKLWNGKGYDKNGNIIFEIKNGKGKVIMNLEGNYWIEAEYSNGKLNGKGKEYMDNQLVFEGEYLNGQKWNGNEKLYNKNKELFAEIEYINGEKRKKY